MSRRKARSWAPAWRITGSTDFLRKLDAVSVRVEHVEDPHRAVELHDHADLDSGFPQAIGLHAHVGNGHRGDSALVPLRLPERDLHIAALEPHPAAVRVGEGLLEAEHTGIERPRGVEIADAVPDVHSQALCGHARVSDTVTKV